MKKVSICLITLMFIVILTGCGNVDFELNEISYQNDFETVLLEDIVTNTIESESYLVGVWENSNVEDSIDYIYIFFENEILRYLHMYCFIISNYGDEIQKEFKDLEDIDYIYLDIDKERLYVVPNNQNEDELNNIYIVEIDSEVLERFLGESNQEYTKYLEIFSSVDFTNIWVTTINKKGDYGYNYLNAFTGTAIDVPVDEGSYYAIVVEGDVGIHADVYESGELYNQFTEKLEVNPNPDEVMIYKYE